MLNKHHICVFSEQATVPVSEDSAPYPEGLNHHSESDEGTPLVSPLPPLPMDISMNATPPNGSRSVQGTVLLSDGTEQAALLKTAQPDTKVAEERMEEVVAN